MSALHIDFPFHVGPRGATATTTYEDHVRDMIEQLLFTRAGERVMRPDFGCGLLDLVFEPNNEILADTVEKTAAAELATELDDLIVVDSLTVVVDEATLSVEVRYTLKATGQPVVATIDRSAAR
jgi:phage baseplate assembly protein W